MKAKTYVIDDIIVVVMRGSGFTSLEQTIMDSGEPDRIVEMRHDFQRMMTKRFTETIEELTGRNVVAFLSQAHVEPDITIEIFFVDGPLEGFGALELIDPDRRRRANPVERRAPRPPRWARRGRSPDAQQPPPASHGGSLTERRQAPDDGRRQRLPNVCAERASACLLTMLRA